MFGTMNIGTPESDGFIWLINANGANVSQEIIFVEPVSDNEELEEISQNQTGSSTILKNSQKLLRKKL